MRRFLIRTAEVSTEMIRPKTITYKMQVKNSTATIMITNVSTHPITTKPITVAARSNA
jgi:hypothetical protein